MLADATANVAIEPGALIFGIWMLCGLVALSGAGTIVMIWKSFSRKPELREVTINENAITRSEFEEARRGRDAELQRLMGVLDHHIEINRQEHDGLHRKIGGVERGSQAKVEKATADMNESRQRLHERINDCIKSMARLEGKLEGQNEQ